MIILDHRVYADNAATTKLSERALQAMMPCLTTIYGNASSLYTEGAASRKVVDKARETFAQCLGVKNPNEIYFLSGGSEADNFAIKGAAELMLKKGKKHIISTTFEHHAVLHTLERTALYVRKNLKLQSGRIPGLLQSCLQIMR